jgi:hypothetical protein
MGSFISRVDFDGGRICTAFLPWPWNVIASRLSVFCLLLRGLTVVKKLICDRESDSPGPLRLVGGQRFADHNSGGMLVETETTSFDRTSRVDIEFKSFASSFSSWGISIGPVLNTRISDGSPVVATSASRHFRSNMMTARSRWRSTRSSISFGLEMGIVVLRVPSRGRSRAHW